MTNVRMEGFTRSWADRNEAKRFYLSEALDNAGTEYGNNCVRAYTLLLAGIKNVNLDFPVEQAA